MRTGLILVRFVICLGVGSVFVSGCDLPTFRAPGGDAGPGVDHRGSGSDASVPSDASDGSVVAPPDATSAEDSVFGSTVFNYVDPGVSANNAAPEHAGIVEGKDCIVTGCHLDGAKVWVFAGTLYSTAAAGATVAKGEVKVVGPNGADIGSAYTDANGNFWLERAGTTIPNGSKVGVRKEGGGAPKLMATGLQPTDRGCSKGGTCHGGQSGKVYTD